MPRLTVIVSAAGLVAASIVATGPPATAAEPSAACRVHLLSVPAGTLESQVETGEPSGRWLGGYVETAAGRTLVRWHDGNRSELRVPGLHSPHLSGMNRAGDVAGVAFEASGSRAFAVVDDVFIELSAPHQSDAFATGIDDSGNVSGYVLGHRHVEAVRWDVSRPTKPTFLTVPGNANGQGTGINARGQTAVMATTPPPRVRSFIFGADDVRRRLPPTEAGMQAGVLAIANGWAAGTEDTSPFDDPVVVRWDLTDRFEPQAIKSTMIRVNTVNARGDIGGQLEDLSPGLIVGRTTVSLPGPGSPTAGEVTTVANNGRAGGYATDGKLVTNAVTWTC